MATDINNNFDLEPDAISEVHEMKFGIVVSTWNKNITDNLYDGAYKTLLKYGVKEANIKKIEVPGSFELIYGCKKMQNFLHKHSPPKFHEGLSIKMGD